MSRETWKCHLCGKDSGTGILPEDWERNPVLAEVCAASLRSPTEGGAVCPDCYRKEKSAVNHPDHYNWLPGTECIDVVEHFNYNRGCAIKYVWRAGRKDGSDALTDLQKARWYIDREIARLNSESVGDGEMLAYEKQLKEDEEEEDAE